MTDTEYQRANSPAPIITFRFPGGRSKFLPLAIRAAKCGTYQTFTMVEGQASVLMHEAVFTLRPFTTELEPIIRLASLVRDIRHAEVVIDGNTIQELYSLADILSCYKKSCIPGDYRAHCWRPITIGSMANGYLTTQFPCMRGLLWVKDSSRWTSTDIKVKAEAAIVQGGCYWCPRLGLLRSSPEWPSLLEIDHRES